LANIDIGPSHLGAFVGLLLVHSILYYHIKPSSATRYRVNFS